MADVSRTLGTPLFDALWAVYDMNSEGLPDVEMLNVRRYATDDGSVYERVDPDRLLEIWGGVAKPISRFSAVGAKSQNGWSANDRSCIKSFLIPGSMRKIAIRDGDVATVLLDLLAWIHANIRPLDTGQLDDWGYAERLIRGSATDLSNHASGTAVDVDALLHPLGVKGTWTDGQYKAIRERLKLYEGVVRWGADYTGRVDEMHFEINAGPDRVKQIAAKIKSGKRELTKSESDMLADIHNVLCVARAPWGGGISDISADTPELTAKAAHYPAMGFWLRDNVTANQTNKLVQQLLIELRAARAELTLLRSVVTRPVGDVIPPRNLPPHDG